MNNKPNKNKLLECHRCERKVPIEDIMFVGCKICGGRNGTKDYSLLEAKYFKMKRKSKANGGYRY